MQNYHTDSISFRIWSAPILQNMMQNLRESTCWASAKHLAQLAVVMVGMLSLAPSAKAGTDIGVTSGELAILPIYCKDTMGFAGYGDATFNPSPRAGHWVSLMGKSFWHMHHYCTGLVKLRRATLPGTKAANRKGFLESALTEWDYVIKNTTQEFVMLPEIYVRRGETYFLLGNVAEAFESYEISSQIKPDYAPAYLRWAEALASTGAKKTALARLEDGIRKSSSSAELRQMYAKLGGNPDTLPKSAPARAALPPASPPAPPEAAASQPVSRTP